MGLMKIALIKCSGSLNVGNEFINAGGKYLLQQVFPNAAFFEYEFFDSSIENNWKYPTPALLDWTKKEIEQKCDIMFIFSGSIISKYTANVLKELSKIKIKKALIGAGAYQYNDFDKNLCQKLAGMFNFIFTRDDITYSFFNGAKNVFPSIDLAFFVKNLLNQETPLTKADSYALVNIDLIKDNKNQIDEYYKKLRWKYKNVYIIENTATSHRDVKNFLFMGYWDNLYKTISHADYVVTNRIHTAVCCVCNQVPFIYLGYDCSDIIGRNSLFEKINFKLMKNHNYTKDDLLNIANNIEEAKETTVNLFCSVFGEGGGNL